jgi:GH35 family endo-1,4-beta-xylanase
MTVRVTALLLIATITVIGVALAPSERHLEDVMATSSAYSSLTGDWRTESDERIRAIRMGDVSIRVIDEYGKPIAGAQILLEQQAHDFWFGIALSSALTSSSRQYSEAIKARYREYVRTHYNSAVHENALKWYATERAPGVLSYQDADDWLKWCEDNGLRMRGHCIFWEKETYNLQWVKELDTESLRRAVERRAKDVTARYRARITEYDVNNEMLDGNLFRSRLRADIVSDMFRWAKEGDQNATLYVNDYLGGGGSLLPRYEEMILTFLGKGIPVGGIGVQAHFGDGPDRTRVPTIDEWRKVLDRLSAFGLPIKITEYSYDTLNEEKKAAFLIDFYRLCFSHPAVEGIMMWGFWEGAIWRPGAAILNMDFSPRPAANAYQKLVYEEWWTNTTGVTDAQGKFNVRAFYGRYIATTSTSDGRTGRVAFRLSRSSSQQITLVATSKPTQSVTQTADMQLVSNQTQTILGITIAATIIAAIILRHGKKKLLGRWFH